MSDNLIVKEILRRMLGAFVCLLAFGAAAADAQPRAAADKILVKGDPPLTRGEVEKVVKNYEWLFETSLTDGERADLQAYLVGQWNDKTIQNYVAVLARDTDNFGSLDETKKKRRRERLLAQMASDFEKYPDDKLGKILEPIYRRARNSVASENGESAETETAAASAAAKKSPTAKAPNPASPAGKNGDRAGEQEEQSQSGAPPPTADFSRLPRLKRQPNRAVGWVADALGNPIAGANVFTYSYLLVTSQMTRSANGKTGADGSYSIPLNPINVFEVKALATVDYNGRRFYLQCSPVTESKAEKGSIGIVQNFVLTGSGFVKEADADPTSPKSYVGAQINVENPSLDLDAFKNSTMFTFTLTPVGKLASGANGQTLIFRRTLKMLRQGDYKGLPLEETGTLHDIPLGDYKLTVTAEIPGAGKVRMPLYGKDNVPDLWDTEEPPVETLLVRFRAKSLDYGGGIEWYSIRLMNPPQFKNR